MLTPVPSNSLGLKIATSTWPSASGTIWCSKVCCTQFFCGAMKRDQLAGSCDIGRAEQEIGRPGDRRDEFGAVVDEGKADVDVVEQHVLGRQEAAVLDNVLHGEPGCAHLGAIGARQHQVLAIGLRLRDAADGLQDQPAVLPAFAERDELGRDQRRAVMHAVALGRPRREIVVRDRGLLRIADMDEAAGIVEAAEPGTQPAEARLVLEEPGAGQQRRRNPAERGAAIFAAADIEAAIDGDLEAKPVPVRNSRSRTPRDGPLSEVSSRTPAICDIWPTRRRSSSPGQFLPEQFHRHPPLLSVS